MPDSPKNRFNTPAWWATGLVVLFCLPALFNAMRDATMSPEQKEQEEQAQLDSWYSETSPYSCESNLEKKLRDPDSYKRDGDFITASDSGSQKVITWQFRSKNGFGGYTSAVAMCYVGKESGGTVKTSIVN